MQRPLALVFAFLASFALIGCESDRLTVVPDPPDTGVPPVVDEPDAGFPDAEEPPVDAGFPDAGFVDVGFADAGFPDAEEPPPAEEPVYIHTGTTLYAYDPIDNTTSRIGDFRENGTALDNMVDIAIDLNGRMFGGTKQPGANNTTGNRIYQIDPLTAECRFLYPFDDTLHGLTFLPDGRLVVAGVRLSVIDPANGSVLVSLPGANIYETSGDIVGLPDGRLYWTVRGTNLANGAYRGDGVVRIDPNTGRMDLLGDAEVTRLYGLGYAEGNLFGFSSAGLVVTIDPQQGRVLQQRTLPGRWFGATTNPVRW